MFGKYLKYRLTAHYWHGHHVHSPYTYWLMTNVIYERWPYYSFERIEKLRKKTTAAERGQLSSKYCQLMQRLCATINAKNIVQIGCENGWETMYLAANNSLSNVYVEGKIDSVINKRLRLLGFHNIRETNYESMHSCTPVDIMVCMNGSIGTAHKRYSGLMNKGGIMIFNNIHRYENEWIDIKKDKNITVTMDLYKIGICWLRSEMKKENYIVKF